MRTQQESGDNWRVEVVAYDDMTVGPTGAPGGNVTQTDIDKLLKPLALFAESAGKTLNDMEMCPSQLTIEGHVSLDVGGVLLFGVSAGISVSMTWEFSTTSPPRPGRGH